MSGVGSGPNGGLRAHRTNTNEITFSTSHPMIK